MFSRPISYLLQFSMCEFRDYSVCRHISCLDNLATMRYTYRLERAIIGYFSFN